MSDDNRNIAKRAGMKPIGEIVTKVVEGTFVANLTWKDMDGDRCHILLGASGLIDEYCGPFLERPNEDIVGVIEVADFDSHTDHAVYLDRHHAELLFAALGDVLGKDAV